VEERRRARVERLYIHLDRKVSKQKSKPPPVTLRNATRRNHSETADLTKLGFPLAGVYFHQLLRYRNRKGI
jgi:hypothetical protein